MARPRKPLAEYALPVLYARYRSEAARRKIPFMLSPERFALLVTQPCTYCGYVGGNKFRREHEYPQQVYRYNGVDRVQNTLGYEEDNCVVSCRVCNVSKSDLTLEQWHDWIRRIAKYADRLEKEQPPA